MILDDSQRILLVKPTYKKTWEIPGGIVEENESPKNCVKREVKEELGLDLIIKTLLLVDYNPPAGLKTESLMFVFSTEPITYEMLSSIKLPQNELSKFQFFNVDELPEDLTPSLKKRIQNSFKQFLADKPAYFE